MAQRRVARVAAQIQQVIATLLLCEVSDPRLNQLTITAAKVTPDLRIARLYYIPNDEEADRSAIEAAFRRAKGFLRSQLAEKTRLQYVPELEFFFDDAVIHARHMEKIFAELHAKDEMPPQT